MGELNNNKQSMLFSKFILRLHNVVLDRQKGREVRDRMFLLTQWESCMCYINYETAFLFHCYTHSNGFTNYVVSFSEMKAKSTAMSLPIRRLSTPSVVGAEEVTSHHTKWIWYWQENDDCWIKYDGDVSGSLFGIDNALCSFR